MSYLTGHCIRLNFDKKKLTKGEIEFLELMGSEASDEELLECFNRNLETFKKSYKVSFAEVKEYMENCITSLGWGCGGDLKLWQGKRSATGPGYITLEIAGETKRTPDAIMEFISLFSHGLVSDKPVLAVLDRESSGYESGRQTEILYRNHANLILIKANNYLSIDEDELPPFDSGVWDLSINDLERIRKYPGRLYDPQCSMFPEPEPEILQYIVDRINKIDSQETEPAFEESPLFDNIVISEE